MRGAPSRFRSQEMLQELFEEINDYLGDKPSETGQAYPSSAPSSKTAVEPLESAKPKRQYAPPQAFLVESDESEDENYQRYTTSPQDLRQQCLLTCPITEEKPSVCMCYKCNKTKSDELHPSPPKTAQQTRRSWTPTNALGFGGIADKVKQTFIRPQQPCENYSGYERQQKRPSSRGARRRWIPRPKSLPSLSLYVQKQEEPEERHSWNVNKHKHRASMYDEYGNEYDDRRSSTLYESIAGDEDKEQDFMDSSYQGYRNDYQEQPSSSQSQYRNDYKEPHSSQQKYRSNDYYEAQPEVSQQQGYRNDYQEPLSSQQQYRSNLQESQSAASQYHPNVYESQSAPSQAEPVSQTPLPGFTDLPYLTPSTRIGEEHYPLSMKESRALPTKEERMTAYNNAYYHCIMAKSNLIPWLTKQYSKGPPDAMFEYTPKPKKAPKKLLGIFKLCGNNNNPTKSQSPWQPSVSPGYLISPPTSASPAESTSLTSSVQPQQQTWAPVETSISPASNNTTGSTLSTVTAEEVNYSKEDDESFEPVLPRPRSITVSPQPRRSRSRTSVRSEVQPVSILKKTRSSASLQPQPNPYSDDDDDEEEEQVRPKYLAAPPKQRHRRGHVKRRSFSQVEEPVYHRPDYYDNDDYGDDDDYFEEEEKHYRPPRMAFRPRAHPAFFAGSRLNHLRASRSPVWLDDAEFVEEDEPRPMRLRRTRRPSFGRPSSRNSLIVYDDMVPVPRSSPVYYY